MTFEAFCEQWRLRTKVDDCGERIVKGKVGQMYYHGSAIVGAMFMLPTARRWGNVRRALLSAGAELHQNGDTEGTVLFRMDNEAAVSASIRLGRIRRRRVLSPAQLAAASVRLAAALGRRRIGATPAK